MVEITESIKPDQLHTSFHIILVTDILTAWERCEQDKNNKVYKREFIRTSCVGVEGFSWLYKEYIKSIAKDLNILNSVELLAFDQKNYTISDNGTLRDKDNYIPTLSMFRFVSKVAHEIAPHLEIDFNVEGWGKIKTAVKIRNRITHPKNIEDFDISNDDIQNVWDGVLWIISVIENAMIFTSEKYKIYLEDLRYVLQKLQEKDPKYIELYKDIIKEP